MKHSKLVKVTIFLMVCVISNIICTGTVAKKLEEAQEPKCNDPCRECQRVVYQMKFHGMADCEVNGVCRNTCFKVREAWGTAINPFEPFLKDMFGKCEICFRAGHCKISECKDQERNEIDVINRVINSSHLTAKISPDLLVAFPDKADPDAVPKVIKTNKKVGKTLKKELKDAVKMKSAENLMPKVQNLVKNYFSNPNAPVKGNADEVLNGPASQQTGADVSYWNANTNPGGKEVASANQVLLKIGNHVQEIEKLKLASKETGQSKKVTKIAKKERKEIKKLAGKVAKLSKTLNKKNKEIQSLMNNPKVSDPAAKSALNNSLSQVKQYQSAIKQVEAQLKKDHKELKKSL